MCWPWAIFAQPVVTSIDVPTNGTYGDGDILTFRVNFSEPVQVGVGNRSDFLLAINIGEGPDLRRPLGQTATTKENERSKHGGYDRSGAPTLGRSICLVLWHQCQEDSQQQHRQLVVFILVHKFHAVVNGRFAVRTFSSPVHGTFNNSKRRRGGVCWTGCFYVHQSGSICCIISLHHSLDHRAVVVVFVHGDRREYGTLVGPWS